MDAATIGGFLLGIACIIWALIDGGAGLRPFWDLKSLLITVGGTFAAVTMSFSLAQVSGVLRITRVAFTSRERDPLDVIQRLVSLAEKARREGLLALEDSATEEADEFLKRGIQLVVDGTDPELVRDILETDLSYLEDRHRIGKRVFDSITAYAPAFGMIGTLIGLVLMLRKLDEPNTIGPGMAVALVTTLYGALIANLISSPIATKLELKSLSEVREKEMMLEGILSIQSGENPRIVEEKLRGFLAPKDRRRAEVLEEARRAQRRQGPATEQVEGRAAAR
ncbi:MAG: motility protein A [Firmicutes bacterium]|jgi:chemotaxis protein MotA|nr:motility protein A [Bacillota bacterium]